MCGKHVCVLQLIVFQPLLLAEKLGEKYHCCNNWYQTHVAAALLQEALQLIQVDKAYVKQHLVASLFTILYAATT